MSTQQAITSFFGSRKRRAPDSYTRDAKIFKEDPSLMKSAKPITAVGCGSIKEDKTASIDLPAKMPTPVAALRTPRKSSCDIRSYMTSQTSFRPECQRAETPVKFIQTDSAKKKNEATPSKTNNFLDVSHSSVKKSINFEDEPLSKIKKMPETPVGPSSPKFDTDEIIKAANDLVEKLKSKNRLLGSDVKKSKHEAMTASDLKKKLARSAKLAELKSSLNKLGQHATELIKLEKKKKEIEEPKLTKFKSIEVEVQKSPHKGALLSPAKSPAKPAYERFAHLIARTSGPTATLPLPVGYQRLLDLFVSTDTVCSIMLNRGEIITFRKLKPAVQELSRKNFTKRLLGQMATVLPSAYTFRQEKVRNFGSTSKADKYELIVTPVFSPSQQGEKLKMTPKILHERRDAFNKSLISRTMDKHDEFLRDLEPPIVVERGQLTRWHPNFPLDMVPDVPPQLLPEAPDMEKASSAKDVLERAKSMLSANERVRKALDAAARVSEEVNGAGDQPLDKATREAIDKKIEKHNPLKGISKSLLDKIRAKQAAKALEVMRVTPSDEKELMILSQLPDTARIIRTLFVDDGKGVLPVEIVIEKVQFSSKRATGKGDIDALLRRLVATLPEWLTIFAVRGEEYLKANRTVAAAPLMAKLEQMIDEKRRKMM